MSPRAAARAGRHPRRAATRGTVLAVLLAILLLATGCGGRRAAVDGPRAARRGSLELGSTPTGAAVLEGEQRLGITPLVIERLAGTRLQLQLVKEGFVPHSLAAIVPDGTRLRLHAALRRGKATLIVRAGPLRGGRISVDGQHVATTPERVDVEAGEHLIEVTKQGFQPYRETVRVKTAETLEVDALLVPDGRPLPPTGWLLVRTARPAAEEERVQLIYVDGSLLGMTPLRRVRLQAGTHRLEIRRRPDEPAVKTMRVMIKVGETTEVPLPK